jgi:hypothetical protein
MITEGLLRDTLAEVDEDRPEPRPGLAARARAGVRRRRRRQVIGAVAGAASVVAVVGLATATLPVPAPRTSVAAGPVIDPRCAAIADGIAPGPTDRLPVAGRLVEAVWCITSDQPAGASGSGSILERRTDADLDPVAEAFREHARVDQLVDCASGSPLAEEWLRVRTEGWLWVRTTDGRWYRPGWPRVGCASLKPVLAALRKLPFTVVATVPVNPVALDQRCTAIAGGTVPPEPTEPLPAPADLVEALWCTRSPIPAGPQRPGPIVESRARADLDRLTAFLQQPDHLPGEAGVSCTSAALELDSSAIGWLWVRTADGEWHHPRWPRQGCGFREGAVELLRELPFRPVAGRGNLGSS